MRRIGKGVDIRKLTGSLEDGAGVLGDLALGNELLLPYAEDVYCTYDADCEERQLIRDIRRILIERFEHSAVGEAAQRIDKAVDYRQRYRYPASRVMVIARILTGTAQLLILVCLGKAEGDNADAHESNGSERHGRKSVYALRCEYEHSDYRAGGVAYGR